MDNRIVDVVGIAVAPFLIYFGNRGITPKVLAVEGEEVLTLERAEGPRLGQLLRAGRLDQASAPVLYERLGRAFGTISRYGILHGHPHSDNVVVTLENNPVVIDWGMALYLPLRDGIKAWRTRNLADSLAGLRNRDGLASPWNLRRALISGFNDSFESPAEKSVQEIHREAHSFMYG